MKAEDLALAERDALLQLRIGRTAHLGAVGVSTALALDGIILLLLFSHLDILAPGATGFGAVVTSFYLLIPVLAGLAISGLALATKWEAYLLWPWEAHFATSVGALALNVAIAIVYVLRILGLGPLADATLYPWFVPLSLIGISLALLGIVLTWTPWGARQWASAGTALLAIVTSVLAYAPPPSGVSASVLLAVTYFLSAILFQTSGSFLHLLSSGTPAHQQSVVASGQNRIVRLAEEVRQKEDALRYREMALIKREADAENAEAAVRRGQKYLAETSAKVEQLEKGFQSRADALATRERELVGQTAAVEGRGRQLDEREQSLVLKEQHFAQEAPGFAAREQRLAQRDGELTRKDVELAQRQQELDRRTSALPSMEARLETRRKEVDLKTAELLRREGEIAAREARTRTPGGAAAGSASPTAAARDLAAREAKLQQLKVALDEQNVALGLRSREIAESSKSSEEALRGLAQKQATVATREAGLKQKEADLAGRLKTADDRRVQFETALRDYQRRLEELGKQQVTTAEKGAGLEQELSKIAEREKAVVERERRVRTALDDIDRREAEILSRERTVDANEAEVSLRRQEIQRAGGLPMAGLLAVAAADQGETGGVRHLTKAERGRVSRPTAPSPLPAEATEPDTLVPASGRKHADRLPTGTPRLDDLLMGGFPPRSHVALVGEAFVGKEIALYAFVAEGLKRGEPVVLVTGTRSAPEVSENLGVVMPQFREYEQMGMVTWVDASGSGATASPHHLVTKGSDDRPGILTALVQASKALEDGKKSSFRVGFLGLSAVLAHGDERASFSFLQNVVGILKPRDALAMYSLEAGALSEASVESLLGRMDGAIVFRQDRDRTFLSVRGFGEVETRDWIECRATNRALILGSFALERIR